MLKTPSELTELVRLMASANRAGGAGMSMVMDEIKDLREDGVRVRMEIECRSDGFDGPNLFITKAACRLGDHQNWRQFFVGGGGRHGYN